MKTFFIMIERSSVEQNDTVTAILRTFSALKVWHWLHDTWIVTSSDPKMIGDEIWSKIAEHPTTGDLNGVCVGPFNHFAICGQLPDSAWKWIVKSFDARVTPEDIDSGRAKLADLIMPLRKKTD